MRTQRPMRMLRERQAAGQLRLRGLLRRATVAASGAFWQLLGYDDGEERETWDDVESFGGVGVVARPRKGHGEAIVAHVGGEHGHPVIIALRDSAIEPALDHDETALFNGTGALVRVTKDGDIYVRAAAGRNVFVDDGGGGVPLATKADLDAHKLWALAHTHSGVTTGGGVSGPPAVVPPEPVGTLVLRGK